MNVLVAAIGTRGDVQPMVALSHELRRRGHRVTMAVPPDLVPLVRGFGFDPIPAGLDYGALSHRAAKGSLAEVLSLMPLLRGEVQAHLTATEPHAASADVIVGSSAFTAGAILSERFGKPYVFFAFCPQIYPSADHPSPAIPWQSLPRWLNRLSWWVFRALWHRILGSTVNHARAERQLGPVGEVWASLVGHSPVLASDSLLAPAPADHPVPIAQVGAMFVREEAELSASLAAFLAAGPPPVYIGFGSMADPDAPRTTQRVLESARRAGVRAVVFRGQAGLSVAGSPRDVIFVGPEPHGALFPRCAAVVHHGGAGTTHAAALARVPQIVMPQLLDQHYWAHRVRVAGVGTERVSRHGSDPAPLARAIRQCIEDAAMRERARALGEAMRTDGAGRAADLLEKLAPPQG